MSSEGPDFFRLSKSKSRKVVDGMENNGVLTGWCGCKKTCNSGHEAETHTPTRSKGRMRYNLACRSGRDAKSGTTIRSLGLDTSGSVVAICA